MIGMTGFLKKSGVQIQVPVTATPEAKPNIPAKAVEHATATSTLTAATQTVVTPTGTPVKKVFVKSSGLSGIVSGEKKQVAEQTQQTTAHNVGAKFTDPISQVALEEYWTEYATHLGSLGRMTDHSAYMMNKPVLADANRVTFTVLNATAEERLLADKTNLMDFLRKKLRNNVFTLDIILSKEAGEAKIYTTQDKFKRLAELNPALNKLRQTFDLDLDY